MRRTGRLAAGMAAGAAAALLAGAPATAAGHQPRTVPLLVPGAQPRISNGLYGGYLANGNAGSFHSVSATWTEPAVKCGKDKSSASFWVGVDGYGTSDLGQLGTSVDCENGKASYSSWYEWIPGPGSVSTGKPVKAGDVFTASVSVDGQHHFTMTISDTTRKWTTHYAKTIKNSPLSSAEAVVEPPTVGVGPLPLANFGKVTFSKVSFNGKPAGDAKPGRTEVKIGKGPIATSTTALSAGGTRWTTTWLNNDR